MLKSYSQDKLRVNRKSNNGEYIVINNPSLSILIFAQPIVLDRIFKNEEFREKGLCARFIYSYPKSRVGLRNIESLPMKEETAFKYNSLIKKLLEAKGVKTLTLSPEAYETSIKFAQELEPMINNEYYEINDWIGKFHGLILRIAANLHVAENINNPDNITISEEVLNNAIIIGNYYLEQIMNISSIIGSNSEIIKTKKIIKILQRKKIKGQIKRHDLFRSVRGSDIKNITDIEEPLNLLKSLGYIKEIEPNYNGSGRKPDTIIVLNPLVFK